jgi:hypothetical protein
MNPGHESLIVVAEVASNAMDLRATVRRQFARVGYDVKRISGTVGEDPYRDMARHYFGDRAGCAGARFALGGSR